MEYHISGDVPRKLFTFRKKRLLRNTRRLSSHACQAQNRYKGYVRCINNTMSSPNRYKVEIMNPLTRITTYKLCINATDIQRAINTELFSGICIVTLPIVYSILSRKSRVKVPYLQYVIIHPKQQQSL